MNIHRKVLTIPQSDGVVSSFQLICIQCRNFENDRHGSPILSSSNPNAIPYPDKQSYIASCTTPMSGIRSDVNQSRLLDGAETDWQAWSDTKPSSVGVPLRSE